MEARSRVITIYLDLKCIALQHVIFANVKWTEFCDGL